MSRQVYRCAVGTQVFGWVVIVGAVLATVGLVAMLVRGLGQAPLVVVLIILAIAAAIYLWRFALHPRVEFNGQLWVVNPMRTHILEAAEVTDIVPGPDGLLVHHNDGVVEAWAVQKSSRHHRSGHRTRADEVAERLLAALRGTDTNENTNDTDGSSDTSSTKDVPASPVSPPTLVLPAATPSATPEPEPVAEPEPVPTPPADNEWPTLEMPITLPARTEDEGEEGDPEQGEGEKDDQEVDDEDDDDLIIRRASPSDLDTLVSLEHRISTGALGHIFRGMSFPTEAVTERWDAALGDRGTKVRIAEVDGDPVGYLCYDQHRLRQVGLTSEHTGRGHGRSLVEYAVDDMFSRGVDRVELQVLEGNTAARGFYRHLGWDETADRTPSDFAPHPVEVTMTFRRQD